jgi:hypothetical protein
MSELLKQKDDFDAKLTRRGFCKAGAVALGGVILSKYLGGREARAGQIHRDLSQQQGLISQRAHRDGDGPADIECPMGGRQSPCRRKLQDDIPQDEEPNVHLPPRGSLPGVLLEPDRDQRLPNRL